MSGPDIEVVDEVKALHKAEVMLTLKSRDLRVLHGCGFQ